MNTDEITVRMRTIEEDGWDLVSSEFSWTDPKPVVCVWVRPEDAKWLQCRGFEYVRSQWDDRPRLLLRLPEPLYGAVIYASDYPNYGICGELWVDSTVANARGGVNHISSDIMHIFDSSCDFKHIFEELIKASVKYYNEYNERIIKELYSKLEE